MSLNTSHLIHLRPSKHEQGRDHLHGLPDQNSYACTLQRSVNAGN